MIVCLSRSMAKKSAARAPAIGPQYISYRKVPESLGEGRVCLYDSRGGLPETALPVPDALLKKLRWVLVHFPSRRFVGLKTKPAGLAYLADIHKGEDKLGIVPKIERNQKRPKKQTAASKPPTPAPAPATQAPVKEGVKEEKEEVKAEEVERPDIVVTEVPEGSSFDAAVQHVFPVSRITRELEMMLQASAPIYSKEGDYLGESPAYQVRMQALKTLMEYHQGRPGERVKPPEEKKKLSYEELRAWVTGSPSALEYMERLCKDAAEAQAAAKEKAKEEVKAG